jgi:hypothetical protein
MEDVIEMGLIFLRLCLICCDLVNGLLVIIFHRHISHLRLEIMGISFLNFLRRDLIMGYNILILISYGIFIIFISMF